MTHTLFAVGRGAVTVALANEAIQHAVHRRVVRSDPACLQIAARQVELLSRVCGDPFQRFRITRTQVTDVFRGEPFVDLGNEAPLLRLGHRLGAAVARLTQGAGQFGGGVRKVGSVGVPISDTEARIVDLDTGLIDLPDQIESQVTMSATRMLDNAVAPVTMDIELRDWRGEVVNTTQPLEVAHDTNSAGGAAIGDVDVLGNGLYRVTLTPAAAVGQDRFAVTYVSGFQTRHLLPVPQLHIQDHRADLDHDGVVDFSDVEVLLAAFGLTAEGDANGDGVTSLADLALVLGNL